MLILGIDTTEKNINLALADDKKILYEIEETSPKTEELINQIDTLFKKSKKTGISQNFDNFYLI